MLKDTYAKKAISQIPRLLGNLDRNEFSPTYGCFHRDYWLDKTSDFPDAVRQFGVHSLALVYKHDFPGSIYKGNTRVRDWAIAGMLYWCSIQHGDGSFDEFYPYERGWVGPSAFTAYTVIESFNLLQDEMTVESKDRIRRAVSKVACFIAVGDREGDHLANHHAMACLALWKAYRLLGDDRLRTAYDRAYRVFLTYHNAEEGWSREYDGIDPGYLSATVSFLGKVYQDNRDPAILQVLEQSVGMCAYFAYPNGFFAGSLGSRNTLHFYPHGFEILADEVPLAGAVADKMLVGLAEGKLVAPEIMSDRYVYYRVPEFLQAYLDYKTRPDKPVELPHARDGLRTYFADAKVFARNTRQKHTICNLAKGGVAKVFDRQSGKLILNDCGVIARLGDDRVVSSQWIDPGYQIDVTDTGWHVSGWCNYIPAHKSFTVFRSLVFRCILFLLGRSPRFSHFLKGRIRKMLITGQRKSPIRFSRSLKIEGDGISLVTELELSGVSEIKALSIGGEFFVRYVPQSRYFQSQELDIEAWRANAEDVRRINVEKKYRHLSRI